MMAGAFLGARLGSTAFRLHREDQLTLSNLLGSINWLQETSQMLGSWLGVSLVTSVVRPSILSAIRIGPVATLPILAGLAGATLTGTAVSILRPDREPASISRMGTGSIVATTATQGALGRPTDDPTVVMSDEDLIRTP